MEIKEKITLDALTKDSVSVLRQKFITINGESEDYYNAVMAVWEV